VRNELPFQTIAIWPNPAAGPKVPSGEMGGFANRFETVNRESGGPVEEPGKELGSVRQAARTCPSCGNEFSGAMEFCPVCMLRWALPGAVESGASSFEKAVKPTPDQQRSDLSTTSW
jgi:hypothetical protein